jgi:hypothetical protein
MGSEFPGQLVDHIENPEKFILFEEMDPDSGAGM